MKSNKGFTLIEIIVVVVILAVLLVVAVPSLLNYLNTADDARYMSTSRSVYTSAVVEEAKYYAKNRNHLKVDTNNELYELVLDAIGNEYAQLKVTGITYYHAPMSTTSGAVIPSGSYVVSFGNNNKYVLVKPNESMIILEDLGTNKYTWVTSPGANESNINELMKAYQLIVKDVLDALGELGYTESRIDTATVNLQNSIMIQVKQNNTSPDSVNLAGYDYTYKNGKLVIESVDLFESMIDGIDMSLFSELKYHPQSQMIHVKSGVYTNNVQEKYEYDNGTWVRK